MDRFIAKIRDLAWSIAVGIVCIALGVEECGLVDAELKFLRTLTVKDLITYLRERGQ